MNKLFALSLLMLSPSVIYGMHDMPPNMYAKGCCTTSGSGHCSQKMSHDISALRKFAVDVDVELKLPDDFKNRLVADSKTKFTVNLDDSDAIGHPIFGLYLNKNRVVEAYAGKGKVGPSQYLINLSVNRTNDPHWMNLSLYSEYKKRLLNFHSHISDSVAVGRFVALAAATLKISQVGDMLDIFDETFKPDTIEVAIAARAVGEGVELTEEEQMAMNDDKVTLMTLSDSDDIPFVEIIELVSQEGREALAK